MTSASVPDDLVDAALRAAEELGRDVADVSVLVIARHAGISRSTLLRRLGGSRAALDDAVRARGLDPGGIAPVRTRALDAAALLIDEKGLAAVTLEDIAARAECSVPSLYAVFSTRDGLMRAVFERHSPLFDVEEFFAEQHGDLRATVRSFYGLQARALSRTPRVVPAMFSEMFARPDGPIVQAVFGHTGPRMFGALSRWLSGEMAAGRVRQVPVALVVQQLMAPMLIHILMRPAVERIGLVDQPDIDTVCDAFADTFVRAFGNVKEGE